MTEPQFYTSLQASSDFDAMALPESYAALPADWLIGTSDIIGSTQAIEDGRYKAVNMVGAAVISAQINAHGGAQFPFVFGGDGAAFAIPPNWADGAREALSAVRVWAAEEFNMKLRVGMVSVRDIRSAGRDVRVARYLVPGGVDYAMFSGGGVSWAEERMKAGQFDLPPAAPGTRPDLSGLSCRWNHMPAQNGTILSMVVVPAGDGINPEFTDVVQQVVELARGLNRSGHPAPEGGPAASWPPAGAKLEVRALGDAKGRWRARRKVLFEALLVKVMLITGLKLGAFDARKYQRSVGENADFRKFDDGLKMTLDCDPQTDREITELLKQAQEAGILRFGLHRQTEAMMTCIVPSVMTNDHVHFVDGAAGGYTAAAKSLKG